MVFLMIAILTAVRRYLTVLLIGIHVPTILDSKHFQHPVCVKALFVLDTGHSEGLGPQKDIIEGRGF